MRACILTENEEAIADLRVKDEKRKAKESKANMQKAKKAKKPTQEEERNSEDEDDPVDLQLDDSSEYSDEVEEVINSPYPFVDKEPEVGDFILVELELEEGRNVGGKVCYVGQIMGVGEDGSFSVSFLRINSSFYRDTFRFPIIEDISDVPPNRCKGVLMPLKGSTKRLSSLVKISTPLNGFNMR